MSDDAMLQEHRKTYSGFVRLFVFSTAATAITLALMALVLL
ncbi:MAG: aa3-type cytochrome c oxidase subunit IV [Kiloniellales bacterium]